MAECYLLTTDGRRCMRTDGGTLADMASSLGLNPDSLIFLRGKVPVPMTTVPTDGEEIRVISVASGG